MKIAFFDTKPYDRIWFDVLAAEYRYEIKYYEYRLNRDTAFLARGYDAVCAFVNDIVDAETIDVLHQGGVGAIVLRSAGYNHVDFKAAFGKIHVMRVPSYSPEAVAEHAMALLLSVNRKTHRAFSRTRDFNFSINGLMGSNLHEKVCGVVGTGKIGRCFINIARGFGMEVVAYDPYPIEGADWRYVELDELFEKSDVISLHCPLTPDTKHLVNAQSIAKMREGVMIVNTSRGALVDTEALIEGLKEKHIGGAGLDVYEEEEEVFFEDLSNEIPEDDHLARLLTFPNVLVTSHQAFFTREAMQAIAITTMENLYAYESGGALVNEICYQCDKKGHCEVKEGVGKCF